MSSLHEQGFLCPECMLSLSSSEELISHFDLMHVSSPAEKPVTVPEVSSLVKDYERLVCDFSMRNENLQEGLQSAISRELIFEELLSNIISGTPISFDVSRFEEHFRLKIEGYLGEINRHNVIKQEEESRHESKEMELKNSQAVIADLQFKLAELETTLAENDAMIDSLSKDVKNLRTELVELQSTEKDSKKNLQRSVSVQFSNENLCHKTSNLTNVTGERRSSATCLVSNQTEELVRRLEIKSKSLINQDEEITELKRSISLLKKNVKEHQETESDQTQSDDMVNPNGRVDETPLEGETLLNKNIAAQEKSAQFDSALTKFRHSETDLKKIVEELTTRLSETESEHQMLYKTHSTSILENETMVTSLQTELDANLLELQKLRNRNIQLESAMTELKNSESNLKQVVDELKTRLSASESEHKMLCQTHSAALLEHQTLLTGLQSRLNTTLSEHQTLTEQFTTTQSNNAQLESAMTELKNSEARLRTAVDELTTRLSKSESEHNLFRQAQLAAVTEHQTARNSLQSKLDTTLLEHQTLMDQYIAAQDKNSQLEGVLETCHQELENLQRIVLDLGRQNQTLQISLERLTNRQWVDDEAILSCSSCNQAFSISVRKHHCRHCGGVFCQACSMKKAATPASRTPLRVCDSCFTELTDFR